MARRKNIKYSDMELSWIKQNSKLPRKELQQKFCKKFNRNDVSLGHIKELCFRKGWLTGRTGFFEKGHQPSNKGKKMPYNEKSAKTQFKKGNKSHNTKYLRHERITKDGYVEISVDEVNPYTGYERRYILKHKYLWEKLNGKLDRGMCLKNLDGNKKNTDPSNWEAIPRGALPFLNGWRGYNYEDMPYGLRPVVLRLAKLRYLMSESKKQLFARK